MRWASGWALPIHSHAPLSAPSCISRLAVHSEGRSPLPDCIFPGHADDGRVFAAPIGCSEPFLLYPASHPAAQEDVPGAAATLLPKSVPAGTTAGGSEQHLGASLPVPPGGGHEEHLRSQPARRPLARPV